MLKKNLNLSDKPLVSVCMITYNHEKYIAEAIEGVLMQEVDFEVELIIADDCSTDRTGEIVKSFIETHPRGNWIKYTYHQENRGMMSNFIWAMEQCQGEYIALCEGDDYWIDKRKLRKQTNFLLENSEFSLVSHYSKKIIFDSCDFQTFGKLYRDVYDLNDPDYHFLAIPTASIVFRNVIKFPLWVYKVYAGDRALIFLASHYGKIKVLDFYGAIYRVHHNGIEQKYKKDKFSLPRRNLTEYPVYYNLALPKFKNRIARKIAWNHFYLSIQYFLNFKIFRLIEHITKSMVWRIKSIS